MLCKDGAIQQICYMYRTGCK